MNTPFTVITQSFLFFAAPTAVFAQQTPAPTSQGTQSPAPYPGGTQVPAPADSGGSVSLDNPLGEQSLIGLFNSLLDVIMIFAVPIIVFFIIYAGFQYVTARGDTTKVQNAHRALLYAVVGGVLILGAKVLLAVISGTIDSLRI